MATPRAANHRDLEQRLRDTERLVRQLVGASLRRQQLGVTEGDFVVAGGGGILVKDGGYIRADHPNGAGGVYFGPFGPDGGAADAHGLGIFAADGQNIMTAGHGYDDTRGATFGGADPLDNFDVWADGVQVTADNVSTYADESYTSCKNGSYLWVGEGTAGNIWLHVNGGRTIYLAGVTEATSDMDVLGIFRLPNVTSGGSTSNVFLNAANRVYKVTSALRYKQDVADVDLGLDADELLDALRPRTWRDRAEVADDPDTDRWHVGYIADELHDAGLREFVLYDEHGEVDGIAYDRLTVPLVQVAKHQREQLREQQQQLDDQAELIRRLTERVEALEGTAT